MATSFPETTSSSSSSSIIQNGIQFERPVGAKADTQELEYIAALHQVAHRTKKDKIVLRQNGTILAKDIQVYLRSRHGIAVDIPSINSNLLFELAGTTTPFTNSNNAKQKKTPSKAPETAIVEPHMDLVQLTSLLLIPLLRQEEILESKRPSTSVTRGIPEHVLLLMEDELETQGISVDQFQELNDNFETATRLTPDLLRCLLEAYGETNVEESIVEEMVALASEDEDRKTFWNPSTFIRALTADIQHYDPENNYNSYDTSAIPTTHYEDAMEISSGQQRRRRGGQATEVPTDQVNVFPHLEQAADGHRSQAWTVLLWVTFAWSYALYCIDAYWVDFDGCLLGTFGCDVAAYIVNGLLHFIQIGALGLVYISVGSLGNHSTPLEPGVPTILTAMGVLLGMIVVALFTLLPAFLEGEVLIWNTTRSQYHDHFEALYWIGFILGFLLFFLQFLRFCDVLCGPLGGAFGAGGRTRLEMSTKQAAVLKTNLMVDHAMLLHCPPAFPGQKQQRGQRLFGPKHGVSDVVIEASDKLHKRAADQEQNAALLERMAMEQYDRDVKRKNKDKKDTPPPTNQQKALLHYQATRHLTEPAGGVLWAYERMLNGALFQDEGIWLHARLIASNVAQWFVVVFSLIVLFVFLDNLDEQLEEHGSFEISRRLQVIRNNEILQDPSTDGSKIQRTTHHYHPHPQYIPHNHSPRHRHRHHRRYLQTPDTVIVDRYNDTHYTDGDGVYPNLIYDHNRSHFTDGSSSWDFATYSHNGTHVFDRYYNYNETHFTDGLNYYTYADYATNGTHISNGDYIFDGIYVTSLRPGAGHVNNVEQWEYQAALAAGFIAAIIATIGIAVVYIPSFVSTVLKYRTGVYGSLRGPGFEQFKALRDNPDHVTMYVQHLFFCVLQVCAMADQTVLPLLYISGSWEVLCGDLFLRRQSPG